MLHGSCGSGQQLVWCGVVWYRTLGVKLLPDLCPKSLSLVIHLALKFLVWAEDGIVALRKADMCCTSSFTNPPSVVLETILVLVELNTDHSQPQRVELQPLPFSSTLAFSGFRQSLLGYSFGVSISDRASLWGFFLTKALVCQFWLPFYSPSCKYVWRKKLPCIGVHFGLIWLISCKLSKL